MSALAHLLKELLPLLEKYTEEEEESSNLTAFVAWLNRELALPTTTRSIDRHPAMHTDAMISAHLSRLSKFAKRYSKVALRASPLAGIDDFVILVSLTEGPSGKSEVIARNLIEFNTGIGIIRRLLRNGLIEEIEDKEDKRSKRVRITPGGFGVLEQIYQGLDATSHIITADLSEGEKNHLLGTLQHLDHHHIDAFEGHVKDLETLAQDAEEED